MPSEGSLYIYIFFTNVLRLLEERNLTKHDLSELSGVSISFLSDLTTGKANPSLKVMEAIAQALETPLPLLLESTDLSPELLASLGVKARHPGHPPGHEWVAAMLPEHQAFIVKKWAAHTRAKLKTRQA